MTRKDPQPAFCFKVTVSITGLATGEAYFKSVGGLKMETEVTEYRAGGVNDSQYKLVGATKWANIVLKRGFTGSRELLDWREAWLKPSGTKTRATITIEQLDTKLKPNDPVSGKPYGKWTFVEGWPCKWEMSEYDASKNEVAIETLEIAHHGMRL
jgi:phage tail-like protein